MNKGNSAHRIYEKVSDEQRSLLIDLLSQSDHANVREAADLLQIKYESAKSIWSIYKRQGRKLKLVRTKQHAESPSNFEKCKPKGKKQRLRDCDDATLIEFDCSSDMLRE